MLTFFLFPLLVTSSPFPFQHEVLVIRQLRHENVVPYFCTVVKGTELWAIMPLLTYGESTGALIVHLWRYFEYEVIVDSLLFPCLPLQGQSGIS